MKAAPQRLCAPPHFAERVASRLFPIFGPMDADALYQALVENIGKDTPSPYLSFVARTSRCGKRVWRVDIPPIGYFYALVKHTPSGLVRPITVLTAGMSIGREGKAPIHLE